MAEADQRPPVSLLCICSFCTCSFGVSRAECIDYGDYLHAVGSVDTPGNAMDVVVSGTLAYVADGGSGLQVIDITDSARLQVVSSALGRMEERRHYLADVLFGAAIGLVVGCEVARSSLADEDPARLPGGFSRLLRTFTVCPAGVALSLRF